MMNEPSTKATYCAPSLQEHGRVEAVTAGGATGEKTDAAFNAGDPFGIVTFADFS